MPGFDGTGPRGMGPMTGGGRGYCAVPLPGRNGVYSQGLEPLPYVYPYGGFRRRSLLFRGFRRGLGRGRGFGRW